MKTAACYIRVSTDDQLELSPDAQLYDIKEFCKRRDIILLDDYIFIEEGKSGKTADKRPEFQKMIATAKIKPKPFDIILVHKFDRFARNREDSAVYKSLLRKRLGIEVISIKEEVGNDKNGFLLEGMLDVLAEYYSLNLSDEVKKGQLEKVRNGGNVSRLPYGYKSDGNLGIEIVKEEAKVVQIIFQKYLEGMGKRSISSYLYSIGITNKNGNRFVQERINYILNNPIYAGYIRRSTNGQFKRNFDSQDIITTKGTHQAIIDEETWKRTQDKLNRTKSYYQKHQKRTVKLHWMNNLVRCSNCGRALIKWKNRNILFWQCTGYQLGDCKESHSITHERLEYSILGRLKRDFEDDLDIIIVENLNNDNNLEKDLFIEQLKKIEFMEERAKTAYMKGIDTIEEYQTNKNKLSKEKQELQKKIESFTNLENETIIKDEIKNICKNTYETLIDENINQEVKYNVSHSLFNKIIYDKKNEILSISYNKPNKYKV